MAQVELIMPKMGESITEATILKWLKKEGDKVAVDEPVVEIATDKVDSEVPSTEAGVVVKLLYKEGDVVQIGKPFMIIETAGEDVAAPEPVHAGAAEMPTAQVAQHTLKTDNGEGRFYSPLVLNIASKEGISMSELETIPGTGKGNRVTKSDILNYLEKRASAKPKADTIEVATATRQPVAEPPTVLRQQSQQPVIQPSTEGNVEIVEMDRMRKLIAEHMVRSKQTSPHVTSFVEADVTNLVLWREKIKDKFFQREKEKITYTPLFIEAIVRALKDFPMINASVEGDKIIIKRYIHIGMATALPNGNLIVPVIKNADQLNLAGLAKQVNLLTANARANKLSPADIEGGTFTLSNVGTFGNLMGTPIINQPQLAVLATGAIKKKPVVIETPSGDAIAIRHMMFLSLSYDHRVIDGYLGGSFLRRVADYLEKFDLSRDI
ncbi:MAG: dihydrolipoamide acetyltransferase component of pyruvate dehydrogenase complex [Chitinophagales bacterium]|nr:MAG: dihydrolipoamide acetyltransferase component of pyruvate dehydrogenase complex [Chitinophagales bacterium]